MADSLSSKATIISAAYSALLGAIVLTGWYINASELIQLRPQFAPMQYNTALGFLVSGLALLALQKHINRFILILGLIASLFVCLLGFLTLLQYLFTIDLAIDQLFMDAYITVKTSHPGRMAPNTAFCFILTGAALLLFSSKKHSARMLVSTEVLVLLILALSVMALIGYLIGTETGYAWGKFTRMALHTSTGFIVLGLGILGMTWNAKGQSIASLPLWLSGLLCFVILLFDMLYPAGVAAGIAYIPLIFCSLLFQHKQAPFVFAGMATVLIILGYLGSASVGIDGEYVITNRILSILAVWVVAILVYQQKMTQEKLRNSEETLTLGWRGAGDGMWDWDVESNRVTFSDRFKELLGYQPDEIPHHFNEWANRLHPEDKDKTLLALDEHLTQQLPYHVEYRLMTKSGEWHWYLARGQALWDTTGKPVRMVGSLSDITVRKESEVELRLLRLAVDNLKDVVVITEANPDNPKIVFVNKASRLVCGYEPEEMIGRSPNFLQGKKTDRTQLQAIKQALENNQSISTELLNYAKDGREYWIDITIVPVTDDQGNTSHFAAIERDITKIKEAEFERMCLIKELEKSNSELDDFAYVASHDLKAPLRVIENVSHWLEEDLGEKLDEESQENMQLLRSRVKRMDRLLDDLLEYSRIGRKMDTHYSEFVKGDKLLHDIVLLIDMPKHFTLTISPEFSKFKFIRMPLQLILLNLISNAIKHHDKDTGSIEVDITEQADDYVFSVKDDGPGIDPTYHQKIFKMFQTLKPRDRVEGSGMGLAIVRKHIELWGGQITLDSTPGQGCVFHFTWPKQPIEQVQEMA